MSVNKIALIYADQLEMQELQYLQRVRLGEIEDKLNRYGSDLSLFARNELPESLDDFDLIVAAGGDGTILDAAMRIQNARLCALRLFPEKSVGFLCTDDYTGLENILCALDEGREHQISTPRLQLNIDGNPHRTPVLNDILLAHPCPARASRYELSYHQQAQIQCSSGIWIATQPGSHGASKSAGGHVLSDAESNFAAFCVRECAHRTETSIIAEKFIPGKTPFSVRIISPKLSIYFDGGLEQISVKMDQILTFQAHPAPLIRVSAQHFE